MRICVLSDEAVQDFDPSPYLRDYDWQMITLTAPVSAQISALARSGAFDVFLNLCEGYETEDIARGGAAYSGLDVIRALESTGVPFTGADSACFDPTREEMQAVAEAHGIRFVKGYQVRSPAEAAGRVPDLGFPVMLKHPQSYGSMGMFRESRADSLAEVEQQARRICAQFGAARMEEFIVGAEYNVLVADNDEDFLRPFAYPPAELVFPPGEEFWHTDVKWNYSVPFAFREVTEPGLAARLQEVATRMYLAMGVVGYGRCDIRANEAGELVILEINPNPGIMIPLEEYGPADYMILYDREGYRGFLDRIIRAALARARARRGPALARGDTPAPAR